MKKHAFVLSAVVVAVFAVTSCAVSSHVETAAGVNFNNYKTFGWVNNTGEKTEDSADNDIVDNNIKNAISRRLENKGWKETSQKPDVMLDYNVMVEDGVKRVTEPTYNYPSANYYYNRWHHRMGYIYYPYNLMRYHSYNVPFKQGTLTINMMDTKTNQLIWQGTAQGDVTSKTVTTQEMQQDVTSIFRKFSLPTTNG